MSAQTESLLKYAAVLDVRQFPSAVKHRTIFTVFDALPSGTKMVLINDHDPKPLYYQLAAEQPDRFSWNYLEEGPEVWQVEIGKV